MSTGLSPNMIGDQEKADSLSLPTDFSKRPTRSSSSKARIVVKNRRKRYLDTHPEYFSSPSLELADPLAYDRLVRHFQSPKEREAEGRKKGYSGTLEADLWRSEAKISALTNTDGTAWTGDSRAASGDIMAEENDEIPKNKDEGMQRWRKEMELAFLRGSDADFDYAEVDGNEEYDDRVVEEREEEERWFEQEEPSWVEEGEQDAENAESLTGQTGVQDY